MAHLWTDAPAPWEYIEFYLRTKIYHCTPAEFDAIPPHIVMQDLKFLSIENKVKQARR